MKNLFLIFAFAMFFSCTMKKKSKNDWTIENLKGQVKSISDSVYKAVEISGQIKKDSLWYIDSTMYNNNGFLLEYISKSHDSIAFKWARQYDSHNNLLEKETYNKGKMVLRETDKYDSADERVEQISFEHEWNVPADSFVKSDIHFTYKSLPSGKIITSVASNGNRPWYNRVDVLDENGNTVKRKDYYTWDTNKKYNSQISMYKNDKEGKLLEMDIFNADSILHFKFVNTYDDKGNKMEEVSYGGGDTLESKQIWKYDDKGNRTSYVYVNYFNCGKDSTRSIYISEEYRKFDGKGNWLEKVSHPKGKPVTLIERNIVYY